MQLRNAVAGLLAWGRSDRIRIRWMAVFFGVLILAAFRHLLLEGDQLWTGEGSRLSWSMRLKGKVCRYSVRSDPKENWVKPDFSKLTAVQVINLEDPLFFLQFAQQTVCKDHKPLYAYVPCRAIARMPQLLIDPNQDLCQASYQPFVHNDWISPYPGAWDEKYNEWFAGTWGKDIQ